MSAPPIAKVIALCILMSGILILNQFGAFEFLTLDRIRGLASQGGAWSPLIFILFFPLASILMLPNTLMILAISVLYSPEIATVTSLVGGLLAAYSGYYIGQLGGNDFLQKVIQKKKTIEKYHLEFCRREILYVVLIRFFPVPYFIQSALCGSLKISPFKYGLASFLELIPWVFALTFLGEGFLNKNKTYLFMGLLALALGCLIYYITIRPRKILDVPTKS